MRWLVACWPVLLAVSLATLLGTLLGYPLEFAALSLLGAALYGCNQWFLLQDWLQHSESPPPPLPGPWGDIAGRIQGEREHAAVRENALRDQVDYLHESFESMRDGVLIIDWHGDIRWCNAMLTTQLGIVFPEHVGQAATSLLQQPELNRYIEAGDYEEPLLFRNGDSPPLTLQLVVTRSGAGDRLLFIRDVTGRARMDEVRRDFVGNVSHELRTPLTVISGYVDTFLSQQETLPAGLIKPLQQMQQQAARMESLLADLLWLSRIESEERQGKLELIDVAELLEELREELASTHPERRLILRVTASEKVSGDYRELYSAVANLVQNAIKYSAQDAPVTISWRMGVGGNHLSVSDLGMGIAARHLPRLTERFYRVDDSRSSATGGTGLGLAIVKHVAASHGAQLRIESEEGRGSTFTLVFAQA
jgi:two-component system phosphate regulon sensor histidine kinase PhoR